MQRQTSAKRWKHSDKEIKELLGPLLRKHEAVRQFPYLDSVGKTTIGAGFNLTDVGMYPEEIEFCLNFRMSRRLFEARCGFPWFVELSLVRKIVFLDMMYNLGGAKILKFKKMLAALRAGDWGTAADEMLDSKWAEQVGPRAVRLIRMMREDRMVP